jgi:proton-dependent oligopeptide transporter, POT family
LLGAPRDAPPINRDLKNIDKRLTGLYDSVLALSLFMNAIAAVLSQAFVFLSADPLLVWNYGSAAVLLFVGGLLFYTSHYRLDQEENKLNSLEASMYLGRGPRGGDAKEAA